MGQSAPTFVASDRTFTIDLSDAIFNQIEGQRLAGPLIDAGEEGAAVVQSDDYPNSLVRASCVRSRYRQHCRASRPGPAGNGLGAEKAAAYGSSVPPSTSLRRKSTDFADSHRWLRQIRQSSLRS